MAAVCICLITTTVFTAIHNHNLKETLSVYNTQIDKLLEQVIDLNDELAKSQSLKEQNYKLLKENEALTESVDQLTKDVNALNKTVSKTSQTGNSRPEKVGIAPQFTLSSRGSFDRSRNQDVLKNISKGSYQNQSQEVFFDIDDRNSWKYLGNWRMSQYTATVGECDANPSITASGKLVTPSFTVAVDPKYWKYGTIFYFQGLGFGVAADCGGGVKGKNRADYLVASKDFARSLDKNRDVYLVYVPNK
jgi:3D (Asp-Asp-Asp) domain-containing protein/cell division protein FtsB